MHSPAYLFDLLISRLTFTVFWRFSLLKHNFYLLDFPTDPVALDTPADRYSMFVTGRNCSLYNQNVVRKATLHYVARSHGLDHGHICHSRLACRVWHPLEIVANRPTGKLRYCSYYTHVFRAGTGPSGRNQYRIGILLALVQSPDFSVGRGESCSDCDHFVLSNFTVPNLANHSPSSSNSFSSTYWQTELTGLELLPSNISPDFVLSIPNHPLAARLSS